MPQGDDVDRLLPERVGRFAREPMSLPNDIYKDPIYATYKAGTSSLFIEFGFCRTLTDAQGGVTTAKAETEGSGVEGVVQAESLGTDPSYYKIVTKTAAFLAWSRGDYYFSVHAHDGEETLDEFMASFPY